MTEDTAYNDDTIFSDDVLQALGIDFEPPLPPKDRLIDLDDEEIIELDVDLTKCYRCLRCHKIYLDFESFMVGCKEHVPSFHRILYRSQKNDAVLSNKSKENTKNESNVMKKPRNISQISQNKDEKFICDFCGMTFGLRLSLKAHLKVHLNQLEFCQYCDGKFSRKKTLERHVSVVHLGGNKELKAYGTDRQAVNCIFCDHPFESINGLRMHEACHFPDSHVCSECGVVCKNEKILKKHKQKHLGLKYPCEVCGALLNSTDSLRGHLKYMHSGTSYKCGICGVTYRHRGNYNDHIAGHLDPSCKVCNICNFEWDARRSCLEHKRKKHPELELDYTLPKVDPTDKTTMEMLKKLIDALPRRNGKPNHLEVCMMSVTAGHQSVGLVKKRRITKLKPIQNDMEITYEEESCKKEDLSDDNVDTETPEPQNNIRKSSRIRERAAKKVLKTSVCQVPIKPKSEKKSEPKIKPEATLETSHEDIPDDNRSYAPRKDPTLEEYDPNYDYTASEDIFVNDFLQETDMYDPDFDPIKSRDVKTSQKNNSQVKNTSEDIIQDNKNKVLKQGETLCQICQQVTKAIKTHLEHYHSDPLLDRVCRVCQKVAMCKRDLKEHVKSVHKKQFPAYQLEIMQKRYPLPENLPLELYCLHCPAKFLSPNYLKYHYEIFHPGKEAILDRFDDGSTGVSCKLCHKSYPSQDEKFLRRHIMSNHGHSITDCVCFLCGEVFVVKNYLKIHLKRCHDGMNVNDYVKECGTKITAFRIDNPEYECSDCNHSYLDTDDLAYHREICHKEQTKKELLDTLPEIQKQNIPKINQTSHSKVSVFDHNFGQIIDYKCQICAKIFHKQELYDKHKEQHDFGLLFCPMCDKHFSGISQKREHDAYKHGIGRKKYVCHHCGDMMTRRKALIAHFQLKCPAFEERPQLKWSCEELKQQRKEEKQMKQFGLKLDRTKTKKGDKKTGAFPFSHGAEKRMCDICAKICCNDYRLMEHGRKIHGIIFPQYEELYR